MPDRNLYKVLEIDKNASDQEIKKAYRKLAMKYHPDKNKDNKDAEDKFKEINEAYEVLSNKNKKKMYDEYGDVDLNNGHPMSTNDIFNDFFGGQNPFKTFDDDNFFNIKNNYGTNTRTKFVFTTNNMGGFNGFQNIHTKKENIFLKYIKKKKATIRNLKNNLSYNDIQGEIIDYDKGKFTLLIGKKKLKLNFDNVLQNVQIKVINLENLENKTGKIIGFINDFNKYKVKIDNKFIGIGSSNLIIDNNILVKVQNIKSQPHLNGEICLLKSYDKKTNKYVISTEDNKNYKLNIKNIFL